jgi:ABC-type transporter Mla maintaining outer membrane lipid asymmetry ATPase subunit MlaF
MLVGFDRPAAEIFVNLVTGAALPDHGEVISLGRPTREIADSDDWLSFVERFGIVSDRIVLLEGMTVTQNLAISFGLELDAIPPHVLSRVSILARDVGIDAAVMGTPMSDAAPLLRSRVYLARALALDPSVVLVEHPTARLAPGEATEFAAVVKSVAEKRPLTIIGLLMDEKFAKASGGRLLYWQPATGDVRPPPRFALWRGKSYF